MSDVTVTVSGFHARRLSAAELKAEDERRQRQWLLPLLPDNRQLQAEAMTADALNEKRRRGTLTVQKVNEYLKQKREPTGTTT